MKEARRLKLIPHNPMDGIESVTIHSKKRGILTTAELQELLSKMAQGVVDESVDKLVYLATALSAATGMRQGEIRALHASSIQHINQWLSIITVSQAFASYAGMKGTKGKRERQVPAPRWLCELLIDSAEKNPYGNDLVFWSEVTSKSPVTGNYIRDNFYKALELIGIKEKDRLKRKLVFHSLRHYFVTFMRGKISESALREIAGHQSEEMTNLYTHSTIERALEIGRVVARIFPYPSDKEQSHDHQTDIFFLA